LNRSEKILYGKEGKIFHKLLLTGGPALKIQIGSLEKGKRSRTFGRKNRQGSIPEKRRPLKLSTTKLKR